MKHLLKLLVPLVSLCFILLPVMQVQAVDVIGNACSIPGAKASTVCTDAPTESGSSSNLFITIIKDVINILSFIVGVTAIIMMIIAAIRFVTAGGDTQTVARAKSGLITAVAGIIVVAIAQSIVVFVLNKLK